MVRELVTRSVEEDLSKQRTPREPRKAHIQYPCLAVGPSNELESALLIALHRVDCSVNVSSTSDVTMAGYRQGKVVFTEGDSDSGRVYSKPFARKCVSSLL